MITARIRECMEGALRVGLERFFSVTSGARIRRARRSPHTIEMLCRSAFAERVDRLLLGVVDLEDGQQLRDLQKIADATCQVGELD